VNVDVQFAAIWEKRSGASWQARHGMTAAEYQKTFDDMSARGYRLNWVCGYSQSGTAHYAAIWELAPGVAWQARHGLDLARYQQTFDQLAAQGYALAQVSGYGDGFV
jgi:DNA-binding transcriptional regulator of glucitol operon